MDLSQWMADLDHPQADTRRRAGQSLSQLGAAARAAAVPLARAAGDVDESVRELAVAALEAMGAPDPADVPALTALLRHSSDDVAYWAATLLGRAEQQAASSAPALGRLLGDETVALAVRERSAWALGKLGPAATTAKPSLQAAANSQTARLARLARQALAQLP